MLYFLLDQLRTIKPQDLDFLDFQKKINQPSEFQMTQVNYECNPTIQEDEKIKIFDVLGTFNTQSPKGINMCHNRIKEYSEKNKLNYSIIFDIVSIHEYAHLIHHTTNQTKFIAGEIGFVNREHYVEAWSQWCTFKVCQKLDEKIGNSEYLKAFELLNKNQSLEYYEFKKYLDWKDNEVIHLFLNPESWIGLLRNIVLQSVNFWSLDIKKWLINHIEFSMDSNPNYITFVLKKNWENENFVNIKKEINIPETYIKGGHKKTLDLLSDINDIGL